MLPACRAVLLRGRFAHAAALAGARARLAARSGRSQRCGASASSAAAAPPPPLTWPRRDCLAGSLRASDVGRTVTLCGWVDRQRNLGGLVFADVRDHSGLVQVVGPPEGDPARAALEAVRAECVVCVRGVVRAREAPNGRLPTGDVELLASSVTLLSPVLRPLPFLPGAAEAAGEEARLRARALDLRRPALAANLRARHAVVRALRAVLEQKHAFTEVETPMLTRSTPEGARDFLVPSRTQAGQCFALPQSPQLFKQLLMLGGMDRYYQLARCFRDEDLRSDRQPEFTQLDIEMSFTPMEDILQLGEELMVAAWAAGAGANIPRPFPRMTYAEAMARFGCDKPDTRYGMEIHDVTHLAAGCSLAPFAAAAAAGGCVRTVAVPRGARLSNSALKAKGEVFEAAAAAGGGPLIYLRVAVDASSGAVALEGGKAVREAFAGREAELAAAAGAGDGDLVLFSAGPTETVCRTLDRLRQLCAATLGEVPQGKHAFLWVTDFPMFEAAPATTPGGAGRLQAVHHPFTAPEPGDWARGPPAAARALAYDCVYNGVELGGGSLRIHSPALQAEVFRLIGLGEAEAADKFGWLLEALQMGAPPHGGIAFGVDRIAMLCVGASSIRDVIAFPKTAAGACLLTGAPGSVSAEQLAEVHLRPAA